MNAYYDLTPGYCFELEPTSGRWSDASDDDWMTELFEPTGRERLCGFREIDGAPCAVFRCRDGRHRAQLLAACERSARRAVAS